MPSKSSRDLIVGVMALIALALVLYVGFIWLQCRPSSMGELVHDVSAFHSSTGC